MNLSNKLEQAIESFTPKKNLTEVLQEHSSKKEQIVYNSMG